MSQPSRCPSCGNPVAADAHFCPYCGKAIAVTPQTQPVQTSQTTPYGAAMPSYGYGYQPGEVELRKWIDWTKTGLLLLLIGIIIVVIPFIGLIGGILELIGAILIILGRKAFGEQHSNYVMRSVLIYIVGIVVGSIIAASLIFSIFSSLPTRPANPSAVAQLLVSLLNQYLPWFIIASAMTTLSYVFFTYAIQNSTGRILLWLAYGLGIILNAFIYLQIAQTLPALFTQSFSSQNPNPGQFLALQAQLYTTTLLDIIPYAFYVVAYFLLWSRINHGEIPSQPATTGTAPTG